MYQLIKRRTWFCLVGIISGLLLGHATQAQVEQKMLIRGTVVNEAGAAVVGATVQGEASLVAAMTDSKGDFELSLPGSEKSLIVTSIGYAPDTVALTGSQFLTVILKETTQELSNVVVVGYGTQKKETMTGAVSVVKGDALVQTPVANISNALVGRVAGLTATQSSGEPGDNAATLRIRGMATLNWEGMDPLVVIDGVQSNFSILNAMDANEIDNISVLKDASATAVYGVRGANGVIIVTTRRGRGGKPQFNFSSNVGVSHLATRLKMLNSYQYAHFRNEAIRNDNDLSKGNMIFTQDELWKFQNNRDYTPWEVENMNITDEQKQALLNSPALHYSSHDFFAEQFGDNANQQQYNLNVSGGSEKAKYFASLGYFAQDGVFKPSGYGGSNLNSEFRRWNMRSNFDLDVVKNLKITIGIAGQFANKQGILGGAQDGDITGAYARHKAMLVTILGNSPFVGPGIVDGKLVGYFISAGTNPLEEKGSWGYSPISDLFGRGIMQSQTTNLNSDIRLKHTMNYLTPGLSLNGAVSYYDTYTTGKQIWRSVPRYAAMRNPDNPAEIVFIGGTVGPESVTDNQNNYKWRQYYMEASLNYDRKFGDHAVTGLLLYNAQRTYDPGLLFSVPTGLLGLASRVTYNYKERYLAEFNMGYNGSENFPEHHRFGFFPAFSAGWVLSNEAFFPKDGWVSFVKFRGSYGEVGNDKVRGRRFLYLPSTWSNDGGWPGGYNFGDGNGSTQDPYYTGAYESVVGNPDVTWERARKSNIALEINMFKNKLTFTGDIFQEKRDNILWYLGTVPAIVAADLPPANIGKVNNKGYELQLGWSDRINEFRYGIRTSVSYAKNTIIFQDEPLYPYEWMNETGFALGQYKGFKSAGFYNTAEEVYNRPYSAIDGNKVQTGDLRFVDIDGDGKLDINDNVPVGYGNHPRLGYNGTLELGYKGFSLSALFIGADQGSFRITDFYLLNPFYMTSGGALQFQYDGHWTPEKAANGEEITFPRASIRTYSTISGVNSDFWITSTRFLKLKNVEISYSFAQWKSLQRIGVSNLRVYANGNNLYTWKSSRLISGIDPEQQDAGGAGQGYVYPMTRIFNFGLQLQF
ncbi:MAG: TonB-dependent receptor [Niabella sp.]